MTMASVLKRRRRLRLFYVQHGLCAYCNGAMQHPERVTSPEGPAAPTLEHIVPRSRGGANALTNLLLVHRACNMERGVLTLDRQQRRAKEAIQKRLAEIMA